MREAIIVTDAVRVPPSALAVHAVRASGPGGQNVNKVSTKIELRVDLVAVEGLSDAARARLRGLARYRLDADGRLVVTSQATRNQVRNLEDARAKVADLVRAALAPLRRRVKTAPPVSGSPPTADGEEAPGGREALALAAGRGRLSIAVRRAIRSRAYTSFGTTRCPGAWV